MAADNSLESLLSNLSTSLQSAVEALPQNEINPPNDGISLLDVKNELLLTYLQNLAFLISLKLRSRSNDRAKEIQDDVVKKLVEMRVYLEKGVRPLENRLKYQIDRITRVADDATRKTTSNSKGPNTKPPNREQGSSSDSSEVESDNEMDTDENEDETAYAPNPNKWMRGKTSSTNKPATDVKDGIYRPPKITPVSMPTTQTREEREARRPAKSATLDEFVATELSSAPMAQPSIGSTIVEGGRRTKSERERKEEAERREYEESNFVRLPTQSKKERAKNRNRGGGFGGEEWRGLGAGLDRIERLTQGKSNSLGTLAKSRKRPVEDGPRSSGSAMGDAFEKRRKVVSRYR